MSAEILLNSRQIFHQTYQYWRDPARLASIASSEREKVAGMLDMKYDHTHDVVHDMRLIVVGERLDIDPMLAEAMAWWHDHGRLLQTYLGTFNDSVSFDHAQASARAFEQSYADFPEKAAMTQAIAYHSAHALPHATMYDHLLRDADKCGILWPMEKVYGHMAYRETEADINISPRVLDDIFNCRSVKIYGKPSKIDMILVRLSWIFDLNFHTSKEIFAARNYPQRLLRLADELYGSTRPIAAYRQIKELVSDWQRNIIC